MLFLILSLGLGVYNAAAARTINRNAEDKVRYAVGADVVVQPHWADARGAARRGEPAGPGAAAGQVRTPVGRAVVRALARPAGRRPRDEGLPRREVIAYLGRDNTKVTLMGVVPHEFGRVAWFRSDLLPVHPNGYLNLLQRKSQGAAGLVGPPRGVRPAPGRPGVALLGGAGDDRRLRLRVRRLLAHVQPAGTSRGRAARPRGRQPCLPPREDAAGRAVPGLAAQGAGSARPARSSRASARRSSRSRR